MLTCERRRWSTTLSSPSAPRNPIPTQLLAWQQTFAPSFLQQRAFVNRISLQGACSRNPALGSREPRRRDPSSGEAPPRAQPCPARLKVASSLLAAGSKCKQNRASCPPKPLGGRNSLSPAPRAAAPQLPVSSKSSSAPLASGHTLPALREAKYKHSGQRSAEFPFPPCHPELGPSPLSCCRSSSPTSLSGAGSAVGSGEEVGCAAGSWRRVSLEGWVAGKRLRCRGSQPAGGNVPLGMLGSPRAFGNRGPGTITRTISPAVVAPELFSCCFYATPNTFGGLLSQE